MAEKGQSVHYVPKNKKYNNIILVHKNWSKLCFTSFRHQNAAICGYCCIFYDAGPIQLENIQNLFENNVKKEIKNEIKKEMKNMMNDNNNKGLLFFVVLCCWMIEFILMI